MPYPTSSKKKAPATEGTPSGFCGAACMMKYELLCLAWIKQSYRMQRSYAFASKRFTMHACIPQCARELLQRSGWQFLRLTQQEVKVGVVGEEAGNAERLCCDAGEGSTNVHFGAGHRAASQSRPQIRHLQPKRSYN